MRSDVCWQAAEKIRKSFSEFAVSLSQRTVTVGQLNDCNVGDMFHEALASLSFNNTQDLYTELLAEVKQSNELIINIEKVCAKLIPDDKVCDDLRRILKEWKNIRLLDIAHFLRRSPHPKARVIALPSVLIDSLQWIIFLLNSKLFERADRKSVV